jgi:uroporphyrinogen decarboxylase
MLEPGYVQDLHAISIESAMVDMRALLPEIQDYVDVIMTGCDDWGTQCSTIASPEVYQTLFLPYYKRVNDEAHRLAPDIKTFIHTCGAIYEVLDLMVESKFDIINPCQWPAGGHTYKEWKDKLRKRASIWGGGINTQKTLAFGSIDDIKTEASEVSKYLSQDGGFIFNNIHNLLAEVSPEKIIALFGAV